MSCHGGEIMGNSVIELLVLKAFKTCDYSFFFLLLSSYSFCSSFFVVVVFFFFFFLERRFWHGRQRAHDVNDVINDDVVVSRNPFSLLFVLSFCRDESFFVKEEEEEDKKEEEKSRDF